MVTIFTPPPNYVQVDSLLDGILVYSPIHEVEEETGDPSFKCPNCGAVTKFDISVGGIACEYCQYSAPIRSLQANEIETANEFTIEALMKYDKGWGIDRKTLHCNSCGAELSLSEGTLSHTCPFCASNGVAIQQAGTEYIRPRFLLPFKIQPKDNSARVRQWLNQGWFHPGNLSSLASIDQFSGIYLPFWAFDAQIQSSWKAEVGYEHQDRYYDHASKEWRSRTVINWVWEKGDVPLSLNNFLVPGTAHVNTSIINNLLPFDLSELRRYTPEFLAGWQSKGYDVDLSSSWELGKAKMREQAKIACYKNINASHIRNFQMNAIFSDESWRYILLPVYLSSYTFEKKVFQVMVNGQSGVISGQKPVDWNKIWFAIAACLLPGALISLLSVPLLLAGGIGIIPIGIGFVLLVVGAIFAYQIYQKAVHSEAGS